jgi:hypothetical protein
VGGNGKLARDPIGQWGARANPFGLLGGAKLAVGALVALIGLAAIFDFDSAPAVWIPALLGIGFASAGVLVPYPTILQRETPPELMGRVSATAGSLPTVLQLAAPILGAALAEWQGVGFVLAVAGGGLALLGAIVLALRPPVGVGVAVAPAEPVAPAGPAEALQALRMAGLPLAGITEAQRELLTHLAPEERAAIAEIGRRLESAHPEVVAHVDDEREGRPK